MIRAAIPKRRSNFRCVVVISPRPGGHRLARCIVMKPFQDITDPSVAKALAHPLRTRVLAALDPEGRRLSLSS